MKILFVWSGLTGYMGDCWRELARRLGVELKVVVDTNEKWFGGKFDATDVLRDLDWSRTLPTDWQPDVLFTVGWHNALCRSATLNSCWRDVPKVCCFDMPWRWQLRCLAARFVLASYLRHFSGAYIPGHAADRYARWLGFKKIWHGLFSTDLARFGTHRGGDGFVFVGRDVREKGTDILRKAHAIYLQEGGTLSLKIVTGISPSELGDVYAGADCLVLPSRWEPWGVVLAEAAGAGVPIICSDHCGARFEVVREGVNGMVVRAGSVEQLVSALHRYDELNGEAGRALAEPYSCSRWTDRVMEIVEDLMSRRRGREEII